MKNTLVRSNLINRVVITIQGGITTIVIENVYNCDKIEMESPIKKQQYVYC